MKKEELAILTKIGELSSELSNWKNILENLNKPDFKGDIQFQMFFNETNAADKETREIIITLAKRFIEIYSSCIAELSLSRSEPFINKIGKLFSRPMVADVQNVIITEEK